MPSLQTYSDHSIDKRARLREQRIAGTRSLPARWIPRLPDSRRPIFIATLRAVASWLFFFRRGGTLLTINSDMLVASASAARTALKNSRLIPQLPDESYVIYGTGH